MFIAMNRFYIQKGFEAQFEKRWSERQSYLAETPGFIHFKLLKSKIPALENVVEFVSHSSWVDQKSFEAWMNGEGSKRAHSQGDPLPRESIVKPPEFRGFDTVLDQGFGHRTDFRSSFMDSKVEALFADEKPSQKQVMSHSREAGLPPINIGALEGRTLEFLLRSVGAKRGVEVGTLGGYSTTWLARALPEDGHVLTIEKDAARASLARSNLAEAKKAGVFSCTVDVEEGSGADILKQHSALKELDFVFIDADKSSYPIYVRWAQERLRKGGLLICDNAYIWGGMHYFGMAESEVEYPPTGRLDSFSKNEFSAMSETWKLMLPSKDFVSLVLPTGEGMAVALKIS